MTDIEFAGVISDLAFDCQEQNIPEYLEKLKSKIGLHWTTGDTTKMTPYEKRVSDLMFKYVATKIENNFQST